MEIAGDYSNLEIYCQHVIQVDSTAARCYKGMHSAPCQRYLISNGVCFFRAARGKNTHNKLPQADRTRNGSYCVSCAYESRLENYTPPKPPADRPHKADKKEQTIAM